MKFLLYTGIFLVILSSCNKVLDVPPRDRLSEEVVWTDQKLMELYVTTCYHAVEHGFFQNIFATGISGETFLINTNYSTVLQGNLTADNITQADLGDSYLKIGVPARLDYWKWAYGKIRDINIFFQHIDDSPVDEGVKKVLRGEMKFRSEEHTSELQSRENLVCRLLLEKTKTYQARPEHQTSTF